MEWQLKEFSAIQLQRTFYAWIGGYLQQGNCSMNKKIRTLTHLILGSPWNEGTFRIWIWCRGIEYMGNIVDILKKSDLLVFS